jgi:hypothetical protein
MSEKYYIQIDKSTITFKERDLDNECFVSINLPDLYEDYVYLTQSELKKLIEFLTKQLI